MSAPSAPALPPHHEPTPVAMAMAVPRPDLEIYHHDDEHDSDIPPPSYESATARVWIGKKKERTTYTWIKIRFPYQTIFVFIKRRERKGRKGRKKGRRKKNRERSKEGKKERKKENESVWNIFQRYTKR
jgi:hypothetical protein